VTIPRLGLRNFTRNKRRTLLTITAVIAGVSVSIVGRGFIEGLNQSVIVAAVDGTVGHVMARPAGYPTQGLQRPVDELLELNADARALLDRETRGWTTRTLFAPLAVHGTDSLRLAAIGFDPRRDEQVFPRDLWTIQGKMPGSGGNEVALSTRVAELLGVKPGDPLVLQVRTHQGAMNALEVTVVGLVQTGNPALDTLGLWVPQALTRELIASDAPSHLSVKLASADDSPAFATRLAAALGSQAEVVTWQSETQELIALNDIRKVSLNMMVFILLALAACGIANTILMAAYERVREIGTLRSMGMTEGGVLRLFLFEGALLGVLGGVLGATVGGWLVSHWATHPIDLSARVKAAGAGISLSSLVYTRFDWATVLVAVVLGVLVAVLASIYPARVASRLVPAEAVRAS
jgi:putative ABC transport system permease protein